MRLPGHIHPRVTNTHSFNRYIYAPILPTPTVYDECLPTPAILTSSDPSPFSINPKLPFPHIFLLFSLFPSPNSSFHFLSSLSVPRDSDEDGVISLSACSKFERDTTRGGCLGVASCSGEAELASAEEDTNTEAGSDVVEDSPQASTSFSMTKTRALASSTNAPMMEGVITGTP